MHAETPSTPSAWRPRIRRGGRRFLFNAPPTTEIYTLSLHDALPISVARRSSWRQVVATPALRSIRCAAKMGRSEEHTSELQSLAYLVCRLLLEKKNSAWRPRSRRGGRRRRAAARRYRRR